MFRDDQLEVRPNASDKRGRSVHEQMVHQCVSEDFWFRTILGIDVKAPPLPARETRWEFMVQYAEDSARRLSCVEDDGRALVGRSGYVLQCSSHSRLGDDAPHDSHCATSRAIVGHAPHARPRSAQHLWANRRHWRINAKSCAHDLRLCDVGCHVGGGGKGRQEIGFAALVRISRLPSGRDAACSVDQRSSQ